MLWLQMIASSSKNLYFQDSVVSSVLYPMYRLTRKPEEAEELFGCSADSGGTSTLSAAKQRKYVEVASCTEYEGPHQHIETEDNTFCMAVGRWLGDSLEKKADSKNDDTQTN